MRSYQLTKKGKKEVKRPSLEREEILDHLYPNKTATYDELKLVEGPNTVGSKIRMFIRRGLIEEVMSSNESF